MLFNFKSKKEKEKEKKEKEILESWLKKFEPLAKTGVQLQKTEKKTFSKFGGAPFVPKDFVWPECEGKAIPFLLQLDFAEVNGEGVLENFPTKGLLYLFVDSDRVNYVGVDTEKEGFGYKEGKTFKILYFEDAKELSVADMPEGVDIYPEFNVEPKFVKTYPDTDDSDEALEIFNDRPEENMDEAYYDLIWDGIGEHQLGGWASYVQGGGFVEGGKTLLLQVTSEEDDKFMWGDCGDLYFFISEKDLQERNFNSVFLEMQCT